MAQSYINIRVILDNLLKHPLLQDITLESVINYTIDFMRIVGTPSMFYNKISILNIDNYRTMLPCDYYQMIQVRDTKSNICFRYATDSFHLSDNKSNTDLTYKIQGGIIYTSLKEGSIEISYESIMIDDEGYPLLPDNSSFTRALEYYIKMKQFEVLFDLNKISGQVFQNAKQQYAWAVGDCQTEFNRLSLDQAESLSNSWKTLIQRDNEHSTGFINNGAKERLKLQ